MPAPPLTPWTSSASDRRFWWCVSCCPAQALHRPEGRPAPREPQRPCPALAPARAGRGGAPPQASPARSLSGLRADRVGLELEPVVVSPGRWWARSPLRPRDAGLLSVDSLILSLRTMFYAGVAEGLEA